MYRSFVNHFGDHIDWKKLEFYSITAEVEDEVYEITTRAHEGFLRWVEEGSRKPVRNFRYEPVLRPPSNVNNLLVYNITLASFFSVIMGDQSNIFLNGGVFNFYPQNFLAPLCDLVNVNE